MTLDNVRQPKPVRVIVIGEKVDVERYVRRICHAIEANSHDNTLIHGNSVETSTQFTIYPGAVNE